MKWIALVLFVALLAGCKTSNTSQSSASAFVPEPITIINKTTWILYIDDGKGTKLIVQPRSSILLSDNRAEVTLNINAKEILNLGCLVTAVDRGSSVRHVHAGAPGIPRQVIVSKWNLH